jgi:hypothetical protein
VREREREREREFVRVHLVDCVCFNKPFFSA